MVDAQPLSPCPALEPPRWATSHMLSGVVASLDREMIAMTPTYDVIRPDGDPAKDVSLGDTGSNSPEFVWGGKTYRGT